MDAGLHYDSHSALNSMISFNEQDTHRWAIPKLKSLYGSYNPLLTTKNDFCISVGEGAFQWYNNNKSHEHRLSPGKRFDNIQLSPQKSILVPSQETGIRTPPDIISPGILVPAISSPTCTLSAECVAISSQAISQCLRSSDIAPPQSVPSKILSPGTISSGIATSSLLTPAIIGTSSNYVCPGVVAPGILIPDNIIVSANGPCFPMPPMLTHELSNTGGGISRAAADIKVPIPKMARTSPSRVENETPRLELKITGIQGYKQPVTKIYHCTKCGYVTSWESALNSHIKQIHTKQHKHDCIVCNFTTKKKKVLRVHMKFHKVGLTLHCPLSKNHKRASCTFSTRRRSLFLLHLLSHRSSAQKRCRNKRWKREKSKLPYQKKLRKAALKELKIEQAFQHSQFKWSQNKNSVNFLEKVPNPLEYLSLAQNQVAPLCQPISNQKKELTPELPTDKSKIMKIIEESVVQLQKRKRSPNNQTYSCGVCPYVTRHKNSLFTHMRTHTDYRPYKCHICEYSAIQKVHLDAHMYKHNGILPFSCSLCRYKCATKASLKAHMCKHTGIKPFKCDFCDYKSARKADRKKHISIKHKEEFKIMFGKNQEKKI